MRNHKDTSQSYSSSSSSSSSRVLTKCHTITIIFWDLISRDVIHKVVIKRCSTCHSRNARGDASSARPNYWGRGSKVRVGTGGLDD